jgi:hypothetical protein
MAAAGAEVVVGILGAAWKLKEHVETHHENVNRLCPSLSHRVGCLYSTLTLGEDLDLVPSDVADGLSDILEEGSAIIVEFSGAKRLGRGWRFVRGESWKEKFLCLSDLISAATSDMTAVIVMTSHEMLQRSICDLPFEISETMKGAMQGELVSSMGSSEVIEARVERLMTDGLEAESARQEARFSAFTAQVS